MATINSSRSRYSAVAMFLHWVIAIVVIVNWRLAEAGEHLEGAAAAVYMNPHKALGITILVLTLVRLGWRLVNPPPPMDPEIAGWERKLAKTVHAIFYVLLIGLPLGGWLASSMFSRGIDYFGLFEIPALPVGENAALGKQIFELHATGGTVMLLLIVLHILGALKHQFFDRNNELARMLPFLRRG